MISFALDEAEELLQSTVRKLAADVVRPAMRDWERAREVPPSALKAVHELSLGLVDVPEALGGAGLGMFAAVVAHEELAWGDPGAAVAMVTPHLAPMALAELGSEEQARRCIAQFAGTEPKYGAVAWSEPSSSGKGTRVEGFSTCSAAPVEGGYLLSGSKAFVANAGLADLTIVFAQLDAGAGWNGIGAFVVEGRPEKMVPSARSQTLGLETVRFGSLSFDGVFVPEANRLLGRDGDLRRSVRRFFMRASLVTAARQVGLARAAAEYALGYTQDRTAFGKPVAHFQSIAFTLADMAIDVDSARWLLWRAAVEFDQGRGDTAEAIRLCAQAIVQANEVAFRVADHGVQLLGGAGFIKDFPAEKWLRDTKTLALMAATSELRQLEAAATFLDGVDGDWLGADVLPSPALQPIFT